MAHIIKLINGDKGSPTSSLTLSGSTASDHIFVDIDGLSPDVGEETIHYTGSDSRYDGARRVGSSFDNLEIPISISIRGATSAEVAYYQREIERFALMVALYWEERIGNKSWLEVKWNDTTGITTPPVYGQWSHYYLLKSIRISRQNRQPNLSGTVGNFDIDLVVSPFAEGLRQQLLNADGLPDTDSDVTLNLTMTGNEFISSFTLEGWIEHRASDYYVFEYYVDADNQVILWWDQSAGAYAIYQEVATVTEAFYGAVQTLSAGEAVHIAFVQDHVTDSDTTMYINGAEQANNGTSVSWSNNGILTLGSSSVFASTAQTSGLDSWRLWTSELTAAQILALYDMESDIKADGNTISPPAYLKTLAGDGVMANVDGVINSVAKDNWGVAGWIPGSKQAKTEYHINLRSAGDDVLWLGRDSTTLSSITKWLEFSGTADVSSSSGDAYESSGAGTSTFDFNATVLKTATRRSRVRALARMKVTTNPVVVNAYFRLGTGEKIKADPVTVAVDTVFNLQDLGEFVIDWPMSEKPKTFIAGIEVTRASNATIDLDFIMLLSFPYFRVEAESAYTQADADTLVVDGREAYMLLAADDSMVERFIFRGAPVELLPYHYNFLSVIRGENNVEYQIIDDQLFTIYITPRYGLPAWIA